MRNMIRKNESSWRTCLILLLCIAGEFAQTDFGIGIVLKETTLNKRPGFMDDDAWVANVSSHFMAGPKTSVLKSVAEFCNSVSDGELSALVTKLSCDQEFYTMPILKRSALPRVIIQEKSCPVSQDSDLTFERIIGKDPPSKVIQDITRRNGWKNMFIFYDIGSKSLFGDIFDKLTSDGIKAEVYEMTSMDDVTKYVPQTVRPAAYVYPYLVLCGTTMTNAIFKEALANGLREYANHWLVYQPNMSSAQFIDGLHISDNIVFIEAANRAAREKQENAMLQAVLEAVFDIGNDLIVAGRWQKAPMMSARNCYSPYNNLVKKEFVERVEARIPASEASLDEYSIASSIQWLDGSPTFRHTAAWKATGVLEQTANELYINEFQGFNGKHFIFGSIEYSFFQFKETPLPNGHWKWNGLVFELMDELARILNFTYETWDVPDGAFGIEDAEGNWNGLIGQVQRKEIDMAASVFSITAPRRQVVDFCTPIFYEDSAVIVRQPEEEDKLLLFFRPFKWQVWAVIIGSVLACGICTYLVTVLSPLYKHPKRKDRFDVNQGLFQLRNTVLYFYGAFVQQGGIWLPLAQSGRILVGCFWFSCLVLVATYTGNLISFLAVSRIQLPFNTLHEMVKQSEIRWGTPTGVALVQLFRDANIEPYISVAEGNDPSPDYSEGLRRVKEENYAFIAEKSWYHAEAAKDCRLAMLRETFFPTNYGMAFPKNSPELKIFDEYITKFKESGILERWTKKWTPQNLNCTGLKAVTTAKVVTLEDFQGDLYILCIGLGLALLAFLLENACRCCRNKGEAPRVEGQPRNEVGKDENGEVGKLDPYMSSFDRTVHAD